MQNDTVRETAPRESGDFLERCRQGDNEARKELYNRFVDKVFGLSLRILKNRDLAQDATHQVFVRVFSRIQHFRHESEIGTWIYRITTNICLDCLKSSHSKVLSLDNDATWYQNNAQYASRPEQAKSALEEVVRKVLATIDRDWAKTFWLFTMDQLSQKEIAKILKISIPTVKMRLAKVRKLLRDQIDRDAL
jgi:RNA polymerase sigma-70 factor (ECF subfamily)